ncbi:MAG: Ubiquinone biosynthesis monooxygenase UbiB [Bacteroidetes bacterium]|nr:Ubiquinone biosynthesis monooxygenase UbiB [Bacteroidota bacterium]
MFGIFRIRLLFLRTGRGLDITFTMLGFFLINWMSGHKSLYSLIPAKYRKNGGVLSMPERLRLVIEKLGPTFVKFGQILADRPDIISEKLRIELKKLQSCVEPIDHDLAKNLIEEQLGGPLEKYFSSLDLSGCIGSASIGQVYRARLLTGEDVVVKIQRPDIENKIELDLHLLRYLTKRIVEEYPGLTAIDIIGFVDEFGNTLKMEMNYTNEASNISRFREIFKNTPYCKIPKVYIEISTPRMLVMEYVTGLPANDVIALRAAGLDPRQVAENGINIMLTMIFKNGFFHADPHAGNLFVQADNRIALIDFGMVGTLKPVQMQFLAGFILGLATSNARIITDSLLTLCDKKFFAEKDDLEFFIHDMLTRHSSFDYEKMNFSQILNESIRIILRFELKIPGSIYLLLKAIATIEKFGAELDPDISLTNLIRPYAEDMVKQRYSPSSIAGEIYDTLRDYTMLIRDFPAEMNEILYKMKQGKFIHEIHMGDASTLGKSAKSIGATVGIIMILGFLFLGSVAMSIWAHPSWMGNVLFGITSVLALWYLSSLLVRT